MLETVLVFVGLGIGVSLMTIAFLYPQNEIANVQTDSFSLDCNTSQVFPIYLQKFDNLKFYIYQDNNPNSFNLDVKDPSEKSISFAPVYENQQGGRSSQVNKHQEREQGSYGFIANMEGFYKLKFVTDDCTNSSELIRTSMVTIKSKQLEIGDLQTIGSTLLGLSSGYALSIIKNRFYKPLGEAAL